jgi:hypothetical protein
MTAVLTAALLLQIPQASGREVGAGAGASAGVRNPEPARAAPAKKTHSTSHKVSGARSKKKTVKPSGGKRKTRHQKARRSAQPTESTKKGP